MNFHNHKLSVTKKVAVLFHMLFTAIALTGITLMFHCSEFGKGINWIRSESYEETPAFTKQVEKDIEHMFHYVRYRDVFETNGQLDMQKKLISISPSPGDDEEYTLERLIRYAKLRGYTLNENYKVISTPVDVENEETITVNWKLYAKQPILDEPSDAFTTLEDISLEVLELLADYMKLRDRLIDKPSNLRFQIIYNHQSANPLIYTNCPDLSIETLRSSGNFCYINSHQIIMESNFTLPPDNLVTLLEQDNPFQNQPYVMALSIDTSYPVADIYYEEYLEYNRLRFWFIAGLTCVATGLLGCLVSIYYMIIVCGRVSFQSQEIHLYQFDRITTESVVFLSIAVLLLMMVIAENAVYPVIHLLTVREHWPYAERLFRAVMIYICFLVCFFSLLRRYKARTLWYNSFLRTGMKRASVYMKKQPFTYRLTLGYLSFIGTNSIFCIVLLVHIFSSDQPNSSGIMAIVAVAWIIFDILIFHCLYRTSYQNDQIFEAIIHMEQGNTEYQIDTSAFCGKELVMAESLNQISNGLQTALSEQVKSERLKADLITNVSHDLKTPLTSIISYVDLIKREKIDNVKVQGYLEVLEQKSQRLKTLTEDLVEASKASSGNLTLEISDIDLVELVNQTNGEFEEKFAARRLSLVASLPDIPILIEADGRRLWRVLENLYHNAVKYAMEQSRVYVDITFDDKQVWFTIKNISQNPLNIQGSELTERFVRGDVSRSTEGSGLGLSIAKTLTNLQNGTFDISIDGDLFKVVVGFIRKAEESQPQL